MKLLAKINEVGELCPICKFNLHTYLTVNIGNNKYTYRLINDIYPLQFIKTNPITNEKSYIFIKDDDIYNLGSNNISHIRLHINCSNSCYNASLFSEPSLQLNNIFIDIRYFSERLNINGGYIIYNRWNETTIYKPNYLNKVLSTSLINIRSWPNTIEKFEEKLNKMLLLQ